MVTLLIDNYDSYTYIIAQYLWKVNGRSPIVIKNNALDIEALKGIPFDNIVISPGPGTPENEADVGLSMKVFKAFPDTPILGVCLGHQCLGQHFGGKVKRAPKEMHGKYAEIKINESPLFYNIPDKIKVVRYHSLIVEKSTLPEELECVAVTNDEDALIMALQHKTRPYYGVQFHPESIGTEYGEQIIKNFSVITERWHRTKRIPQKAKSQNRKLKVKQIDWKDPQHIFETCFKKYPYAFWLDSSLEGYNGRFSFMGTGSFVVEAMDGNVSVKNNHPAEALPSIASTGLFDIIQECLSSVNIDAQTFDLPFKGGFVGYFGYESTMHLGSSLTRYKMEYPESLMMWADNFVAFDQQYRKAYLCSIQKSDAEAEQWFDEINDQLSNASPFQKLRFIKTDEHFQTGRLGLQLSQSKESYLKNIAAIKDYLKSGDTYETCLSNEFRVHSDLESFWLYKVLRLTNPAPYSAFIQLPGLGILSSSPECFITLAPNGKIKSEPIKGTRSKGVDEEETAKIRKSLSESDKDHSELLMIIDLIRNDLSTCCDKGTVEVRDFMKITEYATVLQLSSVIEGVLRPEVTAVDVIKSTFPGGSITGAPKIRTMHIIDELEARPRGVYTGSIGYLSVDGGADFNIAIRTLVNNEITQEISFGSGGAVVSESVPEEEYTEILVKAYALLRAVYLAKFMQFENFKIEVPDQSQEPAEELFSLQRFMSRPDFENIFK